jgi:hypothetical protein
LNKKHEKSVPTNLQVRNHQILLRNVETEQLVLLDAFDVLTVHAAAIEVDQSIQVRRIPFDRKENVCEIHS